MNCTNCGNPLKDGAAFCPKCGTKAAAPVSHLKSTSAVPVSNTAYTPTPQVDPYQPQTTPQNTYQPQPQNSYQPQPQPGAYQPQPGGYQPQPGGFQPQPGGYRPQPGGFQPQPGYPQGFNGAAYAKPNPILRYLKFIIPAAVVVVALIVVLVCVFTCGNANGSPASVAQSYCDACKSLDYDKMMACYEDEYVEKYYSSTKSELVAKAKEEESSSSYSEYYSMLRDLMSHMTFSVKETSDLTGSDLDGYKSKLSKSISSDYADKVEAAAKVTMEMSGSGTYTYLNQNVDLSQYDGTDETIYCYKMNGAWYVDPNNSSSITSL